MIMRKSFVAGLMLAAAVSVSGCSSLQQLAGMGRDDTVLPGNREDAIPGKASFPDPNDKLKPGATTGDNVQPPDDIATKDTLSQLPPEPDTAAAAPAAPAAPCKPTDQKCKLAAAKAAKASAAQQSGDVFSDPQQ